MPLNATENSKKNRTANYTSEECEILLKTCDKYHGIINKNNNRDVDIKKKAEAWVVIKNEFDVSCRTEGIVVNICKLKL